MSALTSIAVVGTGFAAYQAATANKGLLEVNDAGQGGYVAYGVEVLKDTLRSTAIGVAAAVVAHYVIEAAPVLWAMLPAVPAEALAFGATVWTAISSLAAEAAALILGMTLPQVAIAFAVVAVASLIIGGAYFIYKKTRPPEEAVVVEIKANLLAGEPEIEIDQADDKSIISKSPQTTPQVTPQPSPIKKKVPLNPTPKKENITAEVKTPSKPATDTSTTTTTTTNSTSTVTSPTKVLEKDKAVTEKTVEKGALATSSESENGNNI